MTVCTTSAPTKDLALYTKNISASPNRTHKTALGRAKNKKQKREMVNANPLALSLFQRYTNISRIQQSVAGDEVGT